MNSAPNPTATPTVDPERPYAVVLGGSKVSDKLAVIDNLLRVADTLIIGGGMAGLSCAWQLKKRGIRSTIYEAAQRVSGRMLTDRTTFVIAHRFSTILSADTMRRIRGYAVGLIARTEKDIQAVADEVRALGVKASYATADVAKREEVEAAEHRVHLRHPGDGTGEGADLQAVVLDHGWQVQRLRVDVNEDGFGVDEQDAVGRGDERERRRDDSEPTHRQLRVAPQGSPSRGPASLRSPASAPGRGTGGRRGRSPEGR